MMNVLVSGASGLVGRSLVRTLRAKGHAVKRLVRQRSTEESTAFWDPSAGHVDDSAFDGIDGVVHLAGENIGSGRWTEALKHRIRSSRLDGTRIIAEAVARCEVPPTLVSVSAIGYYGDRGDEVVAVGSSPGEGFLAEVCKEWEAAAQPARDRGARVVHPRLGVILSRHGGALQRMLTPFRLGLGGVVGKGRQMMSWIHLDDVVGVLEYALTHQDIVGPIDAVSPHPVTNRELTKTLGRVLRRPTIVPMPATAVRLALGEMGEALLLASTRVDPAGLLSSGFSFRFPDLEAALRHEVCK